MNLYFRLIFIVLRAFKKDALHEGNLKNDIQTRIMPNDLDFNFHVTNGRYLTLCDLARVDFFIRSGLAALMIKNKWAPIIASHSMHYLKPLYLWDKIKVEMEITHWDEKFFHCSHAIYRKDTKVAEGASKALVVSRSGSLSPEFIIKKIEESRNGGLSSEENSPN